MLITTFFSFLEPLSPCPIPCCMLFGPCYKTPWAPFSFTFLFFFIFRRPFGLCREFYLFIFRCWEEPAARSWQHAHISSSSFLFSNSFVYGLFRSPFSSVEYIATRRHSVIDWAACCNGVCNLMFLLVAYRLKGQWPKKKRRKSVVKKKTR